MGNYGYYFLIRKMGSSEILQRIEISEWEDLLFTLHPLYGHGEQPLGFAREDILDKDEIEMLDSVTLDATAVSISEGYEEYQEPVFYEGGKWFCIFFKMAEQYTGDTITPGFNSELWSPMLTPLRIAKSKDYEVAVTIADY